MADRNNCQSGGKSEICIDVNRIFDSCRDKDCFERSRVFLTECGQDIIEKTSNIRVKCAHVVWTQLTVEPIQFNRGFYQVIIRFWVKILCEGCISPGKPQEFEGITACEKKVILFGSEGCVKIFKSDPTGCFCSPTYENGGETNLPVAVCEIADPVVLDVEITEKRKCCCACVCVDDIPNIVCSYCNGNLVESYEDGKNLAITLGFFSVIRMERPCQHIISAADYSVPDKECISTEDSDPCTLFRRMDFPTSEFSPPSYRQLNN